MENSLEMAIIERLSLKLATKEVAVTELQLKLEQAIRTAQMLADENKKLKEGAENVGIGSGETTSSTAKATGE